MNSRTWPSILAYTSARILMFGCAVILLYLIGARGVLLLFLALVISALLSYILLNRQRQVIADKLNGRLGKVGGKATSKVTEFRERLEAGTAAEDPVEDPTDDPAEGPDKTSAPADNAAR
jgi:ABC-type multidrug transport system fused ATPase/permease subunit